MSIDVLNLSLCIISILALSFCLLTIFISYNKFKLTPILYYFGAFSFFLIGVLGIIPSTLIFESSQERFVTLSQAITFGMTFIGLLFLFLAINCAKGSVLSFKSQIMFFLAGGTMIGYLNSDLYRLYLNTATNTWEAHYHPFFLMFISFTMLIIVIELISYSRLILRAGTGDIKPVAMIYFVGWIILVSSGAVFVWSRITYQIPANLYLVFFSSGILVISFVIFFNPASLIASPLRVYNLLFVNHESGLPYLHYDFREASAELDPGLFSGLLKGVSLALEETVRGKRYLRSIRGIDRKILFERGLKTQAVLIVEDETVFFRQIIQRLLILFEMEYYLILDQPVVDSKLFEDFLEIVRKYFAFAL